MTIEYLVEVSLLNGSQRDQRLRLNIQILSYEVLLIHLLWLILMKIFTAKSRYLLQGENTLFTVMMGGAWFQELFGSNPDPKELEGIALDHLKRICNIKDDPSKIVCKIHEKCIAQYTVGHAQRVAKLREITEAKKLPIAFVGSAYDGVGLNDAIMSSKIQVNKIFA